MRGNDRRDAPASFIIMRAVVTGQMRSVERRHTELENPHKVTTQTHTGARERTIEYYRAHASMVKTTLIIIARMHSRSGRTRVGRPSDAIHESTIQRASASAFWKGMHKMQKGL